MEQQQQQAYKSGLTKDGAFTPVKRAQFDKQRQANNLREERSEANYLEQLRKNGLTNEKNAGQFGESLKELSAFSETLTKQLVEREKVKNDEAMQRGMMQAYTDGVSPEVEEKFNQEESALKETQVATIDVANKLEKSTGNIFVGERVRNMSGWAAYGYALGKAEQGGADYASFQAQAADTVVNVQTESGEVKPLTLSTAETPAEYAAVQAQIRSQFLSNYSGMNPALLNKYLFPKMREQEGKALLKFSKERGDAIKKDRATRASDLLISGINGAANPGEALLTFVDQTASDLGGRKEARAEGLRVIRLAFKSGAIDKDTATLLANSEITIEGLGTKKVKEMWAEFGDLEQEVINEGMNDFNKEQAALEIDAQKYAQNAYRELQAAEDDGKFLTEEQKEELITTSRKRFGYVNPLLNGLRTQQDIGDENAEKLLRQKEANGLPITPADLRNVSPELYRQWSGKVTKEAGPNALSTSNEKRADAEIKSLITKETGETDGMTDKSPKWNRMNNGAQDYFRLRYQEAAKLAPSPQEAYKVAMAQTRDAIAAGQFTEEYDAALTQKHGEKVVEGKRTMQQWALDKDVPFEILASTQVLPGTEDDMQALINYQKNGINKIPPIYAQLSSGLRNMSAYDLARAQYRAYTGKDMVPPAAEQFVDQLGTEYQGLLKFKPTSARTRQAMVGSGDRRFLDLVASEESEAFGGYDAYNKAGNFDGTVAYGSGNSAEDNRYGKPISQLTIGEIKNLHANDELHAAGRYQFIRGTFAEVVEDLGLSNDTVFDAATQDRMAVSRARWRVNHYGLKGLKSEWVGLQKLPQAKINELYKSLDPFNQPDVLTPGLRKLAYVTGDIGNGTAYTGEHLDVKDSSGQRFHYRALDKYVEIDDPEYGTISLGDLREKTNFVGDSWDQHNARNSHGIDYGSAKNSKVYVKNGAKVISSVDSGGNGDLVTIELPTGKQYTFLHGRAK